MRSPVKASSQRRVRVPRMGLNKCLSLPVFVVLFLIVYIYITTIFYIIDPWLGLDTAPGLLNAIFYSVWGVMALISYALAICRDPGSVPPLYMPDIEVTEGAIQEVKRKSGDARYCQKCSHYKPPRAHHCRVCKRCVLRMDHHCVWINTCVGHNNYKTFFLFVTYVVTALVHTLLLLGGQAIHGMGKAGGDFEQPMGRRDYAGNGSGTSVSAFLRVCCLVVAAPLLLALAVLLGWHIYLLLSNKTTIEYHEGVRARWLAAKGGEEYWHPYDLGIFYNLVALMGPNAMCWLCPAATGHIGAGVRFDTAYDAQRMDMGVGLAEGLHQRTNGGLWLTRRTRLPC
eukprot:jgi/Mesen1/5845/ME000298S05111